MKKDYFLYTVTLSLVAVVLFTVLVPFVSCEVAPGDGGNPGGEINAVASAAFSSAVGDTVLTITLTGGTYAATPALTDFTITTPGTPGFTNLSGGTVARTSDTVVTITGLTAVAATGSGQVIIVGGAAQATQAASVAVVASGNISGLNSVASAAFNSLIDNDRLTITLSGGTYGPAPLALSHFTITTPGTPGFPATLVPATATVTRESDTVVTITGLTPIVSDGTGQVLTIAAAALATQATGATVVANFPDKTSSNFSIAASNVWIAIDLASGTGRYKTGTISASDFIFAGPNAAALAGGTFTRTSDTMVVITGLSSPTASSDNVVTIKGTAVTAAVTTAVIEHGDYSAADRTRTDQSTTAGHTKVRIGMTAGIYKTSGLVAADFELSGTDAAGAADAAAITTALGTSSNIVRINDHQITVTVAGGLTGCTNTLDVTVKRSAIFVDNVASVNLTSLAS